MKSGKDFINHVNTDSTTTAGEDIMNAKATTVATAAKTILINEKNSHLIENLLDEVQARAKVNCLDLCEIFALAKEAENYFYQRLFLSKAKSVGGEVLYIPSGPSSSYKYMQGATAVVLVRKTTGWHVKDISRVKVFPNSSGGLKVKLTDAQKQQAIEGFMKVNF